jgi:DNA topoisomerase-1
MVLRAVAARANMPEWMLTANSATSNYSSTLISEAPSTKSFSEIQKSVMRKVGVDKAKGKECMAWKQVQAAVRHSILPPETLKLVALSCEGPTLIVRDKGTEAATNKTYHEMRVKPISMIQQELGIDSKKAEAEFDLEDKRAAKQQALAQQQMQPSQNGQQTNPEESVSANDKNGRPPAGRAPLHEANDVQSVAHQHFTGKITTKNGVERYYEDGKEVPSPEKAKGQSSPNTPSAQAPQPQAKGSQPPPPEDQELEGVVRDMVKDLVGQGMKPLEIAKHLSSALSQSEREKMPLVKITKMALDLSPKPKEEPEPSPTKVEKPKVVEQPKTKPTEKPKPKEVSSKPKSFTPITRNEDGSYSHAEKGKVLSKEHQERLKSMRLPPAWTDVKLSDDPDSELQATAKDSKGRSQYVYSAAHWDKVNAQKFLRTKALVDRMPKIEEGIRKTLAKGGEGKEEAAVLLLIRKTGFRIGSEADTKTEHEALGATTLTNKNVKVNGDTIKFSFIGKKGVHIQQTIKDSELAKVIEPRLKTKGKLFDTSDNKVRDYLHTLDSSFKPKDFRTLKAAEVALAAIDKIKPPKNEKEYKKVRRMVGVAVSEKLGNTPTVALASYIPPEVFLPWQKAVEDSVAKGTDKPKPKSKVKRKTKKDSKKVSQS